jgi:hypothetical protein
MELALHVENVLVGFLHATKIMSRSLAKTSLQVSQRWAQLSGELQH